MGCGWVFLDVVSLPFGWGGSVFDPGPLAFCASSPHGEGGVPFICVFAFVGGVVYPDSWSVNRSLAYLS